MGILEAKADRSKMSEYNEVLQEKTVGKKKQLAVSIILIILGLAGLAIGANMSVKSAVYIGGRIGLSDAVIGLSIVAIGTSLPELMTCIVAALKGQDDISIGNLVGSNIFNTLFVVGISGTFSSYNISARLIGADYWIMIVVSSVFLILGVLKRGIDRKFGLMLLIGYVAYMIFILTMKNN
jgi:cation:H+ antiporter